MASMNYFDSDMHNSTNTVVLFGGKDGYIYLRLRAMSHTIYAANLSRRQLINIGWGDRKLNIIHSRLRNMCSSLNADLHLVNLKPSPACICGHGFEDCIHFFLECSFYNENRAILLNKLLLYTLNDCIKSPGTFNFNFKAIKKTSGSLKSLLLRNNVISMQA